jgi:hypothetical protein
MHVVRYLKKRRKGVLLLLFVQGTPMAKESGDMSNL